MKEELYTSSTLHHNPTIWTPYFQKFVCGAINLLFCYSLTERDIRKFLYICNCNERAKDYPIVYLIV